MAIVDQHPDDAGGHQRRDIHLAHLDGTGGAYHPVIGLVAGGARGARGTQGERKPAAAGHALPRSDAAGAARGRAPPAAAGPVNAATAKSAA